MKVSWPMPTFLTNKTTYTRGPRLLSRLRFQAVMAHLFFLPLRGGGILKSEGIRAYAIHGLPAMGYYHLIWHSSEISTTTIFVVEHLIRHSSRDKYHTWPSSHGILPFGMSRNIRLTFSRGLVLLLYSSWNISFDIRREICTIYMTFQSWNITIWYVEEHLIWHSSEISTTLIRCGRFHLTFSSRISTTNLHQCFPIRDVVKDYAWNRRHIHLTFVRINTNVFKFSLF